MAYKGITLTQMSSGVSVSAGVASLNGLSGDVILESTDGSVTITPSGQTINLEVSGAVTSVSDSGAGTLTISPTTGAVKAALNLGNANTWTANQTFGNHISFGGALLNVTSLTTGNILQYNGTNWVNVTPASIAVVSSVSNTDKSLTISPTTGSVVASLGNPIQTSVFISNNGSATATISQGLDIVEDGAPLTVASTCYGVTGNTNSPAYAGYASRGTFASPTAVQSGDLLLSLKGSGI